MPPSGCGFAARSGSDRNGASGLRVQRILTYSETVDGIPSFRKLTGFMRHVDGSNFFCHFEVKLCGIQ